MERLAWVRLGAEEGCRLMDWQAQYATGNLPWDEGGAHPALMDFVKERGIFEGRILIPGCGRGHEVRAISTAENRVTGLDIAPGAIALAREFPRSGAEEYVVANLFDLPAELRGVFDWGVEHTCFCAIDPAMRPDYVAGIASALKPGGMLLAIFYLNPDKEHQPPYGVKIEELGRLFLADFDLIGEWRPARSFEDRLGRELVRLFQRKPLPR
jgi:methyl halide transferase